MGRFRCVRVIFTAIALGERHYSHFTKENEAFGKINNLPHFEGRESQSEKDLVLFDPREYLFLTVRSQEPLCQLNPQFMRIFQRRHGYIQQEQQT